MTTTTTTDGRAGCDECARADRDGITRRTFLRGAAAAGAAIVALPALETVTAQAAYAAGWTGDTIVVISFRGGFDGLSAVAPLGDPDYLKRVNREHEEIFSAIERQDADSARAAMRIHLTNSRERLRLAQRLAQEQQATAAPGTER